MTPTTAALIALVAVAMILAGLLAYVLRAFHQRERDWACERQLLISRVQHPNVLFRPQEAVTASAAERGEDEEPSAEVDESDLVGKVMPGGDGD